MMDSKGKNGLSFKSVFGSFLPRWIERRAV